MNYRHAYHAGNFADVMKHLALVSAVLYLAKKEKGFLAVDTHAGRGSYRLDSEEAEKTGEAASGIKKLLAAAPRHPLVARYVELVKSAGTDVYPGSPLIMAKLLREQDRLVAIEKHGEECAHLRKSLSGFVRARVEEADGYTRLSALLPPAERRGLILIDPPFESPNEFEQLARAFASAYRRFATGLYMIWLPMKRGLDADALVGEIRLAGAEKLAMIGLDVGEKPDMPEGLRMSGMVIVNPPFGFEDEMRAELSEVLPLIAQGQGAAIRVDANPA